jgi:transposase
MDPKFGWEIDMTISLLGIDIAKNTFQLHGANNSGKAVHKKRLARRELAAHLANLPAYTIVMGACGGANYWARVFQRSGHSVKLISPQFVKPFVKTNKNTRIIWSMLSSGEEFNYGVQTATA